MIHLELKYEGGHGKEGTDFLLIRQPPADNDPNGGGAIILTRKQSDDLHSFLEGIL